MALGGILELNFLGNTRTLPFSCANGAYVDALTDGVEGRGQGSGEPNMWSTRSRAAMAHGTTLGGLSVGSRDTSGTSNNAATAAARCQGEILEKNGTFLANMPAGANRGAPSMVMGSPLKISHGPHDRTTNNALPTSQGHMSFRFAQTNAAVSSAMSPM